MPTSEDLLKWNVYTSLDELPFKVYVDVACSGDLSPLSQAKVPCPEHILQFGWQSIGRQFNEAVGGDKMQQATIISAEIMKLDLDIDRVQMLIDAMLLHGADDEAREILAEQLREEGFYHPFTAESYREDLRITALNAQRLVVQKEIRMKEAEAIVPASGSVEKPQRDTYIKCLVRISKHAKYPVRMQDLSTLEFCIHYRDFLDYVESHQKSRAAAAD